MEYKYRYRSKHMLLIGVGVIPFVIWGLRSHSIWPETSVAVYLLTACLALTLMIGYPGPRSRWFWKLVIVMVILHTAVLSGLVLGAFSIIATGIKPPAALFFTLVISVLGMESWVALRLIKRFLTKVGPNPRADS